MNPPRTEAFWRLSLESYQQPGAAELCLALQDRDGRDVNLLLLALYAGLVLGRRLSAADIAALEAATAAWNDRVTQPLRAARRSLKGWAGDADAAALRRSVQAAELEAERLAQRLLLAALPDGPVESPGRPLARANLALYGGEEAAALTDLVNEK
jgi:uncharacterized protein (TIGR02444 family)